MKGLHLAVWCLDQGLVTGGLLSSVLGPGVYFNKNYLSHGDVISYILSDFVSRFYKKAPHIDPYRKVDFFSVFCRNWAL